MTHIQGSNSAQYSLAWLLSAQQTGTPSASTALTQSAGPSASAFDPSGGAPQAGMPAPDAGAAPPPFSRDAMGALMGAQEQANGPSSSSSQQAASGVDDAGDPGEIAAKPKKRPHHHGHRAPQGLDALLQATPSTGTDAASGTTQARMQSNLMQQLLKLQAQLTVSATPSAMAATV